MSTLYSCPKCGTAMEDPTTVILPTREQLIAAMNVQYELRLRAEEESRFDQRNAARSQAESAALLTQRDNARAVSDKLAHLLGEAIDDVPDHTVLHSKIRDAIAEYVLGKASR
jgi:hypothetical protein